MIKCPVCVSSYAIMGVYAQMGALRTFVEGNLNVFLFLPFLGGVVAYGEPPYLSAFLLKFHCFDVLKIKTMKNPQTKKTFHYLLPHDSCELNLRHYNFFSHNILLSAIKIPPGILALPYNHPPPGRCNPSSKKEV